MNTTQQKLYFILKFHGFINLALKFLFFFFDVRVRFVIEFLRIKQHEHIFFHTISPSIGVGTLVLASWLYILYIMKIPSQKCVYVDHDTKQEHVFILIMVDIFN